MNDTTKAVPICLPPETNLSVSSNVVPTPALGVKRQYSWCGMTRTIAASKRSNAFRVHRTARTRDAFRTVQIFRACSIPIRRHTLVRGDANPFDPRWDVYFGNRRSRPALNLQNAWLWEVEPYAGNSHERFLGGG